jgi:YbbR domain-containing protein
MRSLRENLASAVGLKVAALVGAIVLWVSLAAQPLTEASFEAHVQYVNVAEQLELNPDQAERVTVILRGPQRLLRELRDREVSLQADFSDVYAPGEKTLNVAEMSQGLPEGVRLVKAVPSQLRFTLEAQARREVAIQPQFVGSYEREYALDSVRVDPQRLVVVGPESRVALLGVVSTDPIDLTEVVGGRSFRVTAYLPDPYIRFDQDPTVNVDVQMRKRE